MDIIVNDSLELINTMVEGAVYLKSCIQKKDYKEFERFIEDVKTAAIVVANTSKDLKTKIIELSADITGENICYSLECIERLFLIKSDTVEYKIEYELIPLLLEMYHDIYYFCCIDGNKEKETAFRNKKIYEIAGNAYIDESLITGSFKYDVSIMVSAFNNLDYTKRCIESVIETVPKDLNCEFILLNNGSNDGTEQYFDSLHCKKTLNLKKNSISNIYLPAKICEGKYYLAISNDVIVTENVISNLLKCIDSDEMIAKVVPTTPNVSNYQTIEAVYNDFEELKDFARKNNVLDSTRWEQRIRLCDPICILRASAYTSSSGIGIPDKDWINGFFNDDAASLELRRRGYKLVLAKDSYCHHFGSVTFKELYKDNDRMTKALIEARTRFVERYKVDAWATGFCYDSFICETIIPRNTDNVKVLSINPGFGSNPLKIKEIYKEAGNTDIDIKIVSTSNCFVEDWKCITGDVKIIRSIHDIKAVIEGEAYDYICMEDYEHLNNSGKQILEILTKQLKNGGILLIEGAEAELKYVSKWLQGSKRENSNEKVWIKYRKEV